MVCKTTSVTSSTTRKTWDKTWMDVAEVIGRRSACSRAQVGAVVVTSDNRVAACSYNGPPRDFLQHGVTPPCSSWCKRALNDDPDPGYLNCPSLHAEQNALLRSDFTDINGGSIYVNSSVCLLCAKLIANSGLRHVFHQMKPDQSYRDVDGPENLLKRCGIRVVRVLDAA